MMCVRKIGGCVLLAISMGSNAGFYSSTAHSRGNCSGFNESITWNWSEYHWWEVESLHIRQRGNGPDTHRIKVWMAYTWRAAALDFWKDPAGAKANNYWVQGYHYYMAYDGSRIYDNYTQSGDCSGYNGWWDKPNANGE